MNFFGGGRVTPAEAAMRDAVFKATTPTEGGEGDPASLLVVQQLLQFGTTQVALLLGMACPGPPRPRWAPRGRIAGEESLLSCPDAGE